MAFPRLAQGLNSSRVPSRRYTATDYYTFFTVRDYTIIAYGPIDTLSFCYPSCPRGARTA